MEKIKDMEIFKKNLEEASFTEEFIKQALQYFNQLHDEAEVQEMNNLEEALDYFNRVGSFTCNASQSYFNLHNFREDIAKLYTYDMNNILNLNDYFFNIEDFELQVLNALYYEFYPWEKQEEEEEINWDE